MEKYTTVEEFQKLESKVNELMKELDKYSSELGAGLLVKSGIEEAILNNKVQELLKEVNFDRSFEDIPKVMLGLNHIDVSPEDHVRVTVDILNVQKDKFTYKVRTWNKNEIYKVEFNWLAYGR